MTSTQKTVFHIEINIDAKKFKCCQNKVKKSKINYAFQVIQLTVLIFYLFLLFISFRRIFRKFLFLFQIYFIEGITELIINKLEEIP